MGNVAAPACRQAGSGALQRHPDVRRGAATNKIVVSPAYRQPRPQFEGGVRGREFTLKGNNVH